jgi:hypothetical protein
MPVSLPLMQEKRYQRTDPGGLQVLQIGAAKIAETIGIGKTLSWPVLDRKCFEITRKCSQRGYM